MPGMTCQVELTVKDLPKAICRAGQCRLQRRLTASASTWWARTAKPERRTVTGPAGRHAVRHPPWGQAGREDPDRQAGGCAMNGRVRLEHRCCWPRWSQWPWRRPQAGRQGGAPTETRAGAVAWRNRRVDSRRAWPFLLRVQNRNGSWGSAHRTKGLNIYAPVPGAPSRLPHRGDVVVPVRTDRSGSRIGRRRGRDRSR